MARRPRYIPPGSMVEVTLRTIQGRLLLLPSEEVNDAILGVFGRAQSLYGLAIHALVVMGNHLHFLTTPKDSEQLAAFEQHVNANLSKKIGRIRGWRGSMWERRYQVIPVADDEVDQMARLRYILAHGAKEKLVASPRQWMGVHSVAALTRGTPLVGHWRGRSSDRAAASSLYEVELAPLPCWAHLSRADYRARVEALVASIESEARISRQVSGSDPPGRERLVSQDPHERPANVKRSPAPAVHASSRQARQLFWTGLGAFLTSYRAASVLLRSGASDVVFPAGSFPPPLPYCRAGP